MNVQTTAPLAAPHARHRPRHLYLLAAAVAPALAAGLALGLALGQAGNHGTVRQQPQPPTISVDGEPPAAGAVTHGSAVPLAFASRRYLVYLVDSEQDGAAMQRDFGQPEPAPAGEPTTLRLFLAAGSVETEQQAEFTVAQLQQRYGDESVQLLDLRNQRDVGPTGP